jgi:hypothetical protein
MNQRRNVDDDLHLKVSQLKDISLSISDELDYQKKLMGEMDSEMSTASLILTNTVKKFKQMAQQVQGSWMLILMLFGIAVIGYAYSRF